MSGKKNYVFVYGTLMKGQRNHERFLRDEDFVADGRIEGFRNYDLGSYSGIVYGNGQVAGELYFVDDETLDSLDVLEGEGDLYLRKCTEVFTNGRERVEAFVYVYNRSYEGCREILGRYGSNDGYVWYVCYGSNMLYKRMRYYLEGGVCEYNGREYSSCATNLLPAESRAVIIPYDMYYSNFNVSSWDNSAVSFLDLSKPGKAYGRAYKILRSQLAEIHAREGKSSRWYPDVVPLEKIDGVPAVTYAGYETKFKEPFSHVSAEYGAVLFCGIKETFPELENDFIYNYLRSCGKKIG